MKVAVSMQSFARQFYEGTMDGAGFVREAHVLGADAVELCGFFWRDRDAEIGDLKAALMDTGMRVCMWSVWNNFAIPDPMQRDEALNAVCRGVEEAVNFNSGVVRVFSGTVVHDVPFDTAIEWIVLGLSEGARYAASHGVVLALENHGMLAGRSDQVAEIIRRVASRSLGANLDTGNFLLVNQVPATAVSELVPSAVSVHLKDYREVPPGHQGQACVALDGRKYAGTAVGDGDADIAACLQVLQDAGYGGYVSVEYEGDQDPTQGLSRSLANTRAMLEALV